MSDGIKDQLGGPFRRVLGSPQMYRILENIYSYSMDQQKAFILKELAEWQKNEKQTDDQLLVGIKLGNPE